MHSKNGSQRVYRITSLSEFPIIKQKGRCWCGPAVAEAILRFHGLSNPNGLLGHDSNSFDFQKALARQMNTENECGTSADNLIYGLNNHLSIQTQRRYTSTPFRTFYSSPELMRGFHNLAYDSLTAGIPIIVGYHGSIG